MQPILIIISLFYFLSCNTKSSNSVASTENAEFSSVTATASADQGPDITIANAKQLMEKSKDIILIDVRTQGEVDMGVIGQPLHIDISQPDFKQKIDALDKNKEYIVYCAVGGRSGKAVSYMRNLGFNKAYNMVGGYNEWSRNK